MAFSKNLTSLIANTNGIALKDFLATTQEAWADEHMVKRYNAAPPTEHDDLESFPRRCHDHLKSEYHKLRAWFVEPDYKLSALLQSKCLSFQFSGPLDDGFGWDFRRDGDPEPRMIQFKSMLISCQRQLKMLPVRDRNAQNASVSGLARLVRGAYQARAEVNLWRPVERKKDDKVELLHSGEDLAKRWVAFRTMAFLINLGIDPAWCWNSSGCPKIFGLVDDETPSGITSAIGVES